MASRTKRAHDDSEPAMVVRSGGPQFDVLALWVTGGKVRSRTDY